MSLSLLYNEIMSFLFPHLKYNVWYDRNKFDCYMNKLFEDYILCGKVKTIYIISEVFDINDKVKKIACLSDVNIRYKRNIINNEFEYFVIFLKFKNNKIPFYVNNIYDYYLLVKWVTNEEYKKLNNLIKVK